ncbi:MAG: pilus assembly protein [Halobacteriovoraceae bacterium]|nr:pilus assembly protein [Halobacteriovoraceae bacterium]|tara:strand:+ start:6626 stop:7774 length:1149 start_codon:yes stop_codon:yes gene_type:complete
MSDFIADLVRDQLSPIAELLDDPSVSEIMINGPHEVFIERGGLLVLTDHKFRDEPTLQSAVKAIANSINRTIDKRNPRLDARLPDGSRVAVVLDGLSKQGTIVAIRKFSKEKLTLKDLVNFGSLSNTGAKFLHGCMHLGINTLVSGGTGSGKTTMLNVLGSKMPDTQRLLIIEDSSELQIKAKHVVRLEARKADQKEDVDEVSIRHLLESALRLRPDRIIVGEVRGDEALDLLNAMGTGHDGSMGTVHANTPQDACTRMETLCMMGDTKIPPDAIRVMVGSAIQLIVQCSRYHDGGRRTSHISEVLGVDENGRYITKDIFRWIQKGVDPDSKKLIGEMVPCGYVPTFFERFRANNINLPKSIFRPPEWAVQTLLDERKKKAA